MTRRPASGQSSRRVQRARPPLGRHVVRRTEQVYAPQLRAHRVRRLDARPCSDDHGRDSGCSDSRRRGEVYIDQALRKRGGLVGVLSGIASGTSSWLAVARDLRPVSDAGASQQLDLAVGEALEHRPGNVLRLAIPPFVLGTVCGGPDMDDARYDGARRVMRAVELRQRRLREIHDPDRKAAGSLHLRTREIESRHRAFLRVSKIACRLARGCTWSFGASSPSGRDGCPAGGPGSWPGMLRGPGKVITL